MMHLAWRHLIRHWRVNVVVLLCLTLASALLATLSGYATAVATRELNRTLEQAGPAERSLLVSGGPYAFNEELYKQLQERLGQVLKERVVIRHATLPADPQARQGPGGKRNVALVEVYSFDTLPRHARVVEGRLPEQASVNLAHGSWPPLVEAAIGVRAAEQSGYGIGDRVTAGGMYYRLDIVAIVEPLDPYDDAWGEDLSAFTVVTGTLDPVAEAITLPLIIAPESMQIYLGRPVFPHEVSWRITLNHHLIGADGAEALLADLTNYQTQSATQGARTSTGFVRILADYLARLSGVRMVLFLLAVQTLLFVLYTLTMLSSVMVDRSQVELATLSARGSSVWRILQVFALESLGLALPAALLLGPGLAQVAILLWGQSTADIVPATLPRESWLLSGTVAGLGWLALVVPIFRAARRSGPSGQPRRVRPPLQSTVHRRYLDLYLLAFGALLYWQLNRSGSFVMRQLGDTALADPLLLLGPTLLLIAAMMVLLRILPAMLGLAAQPFRHLRGWRLPLALFRLARDPVQPARVVLLVSLTAGLVLFDRTFADSLANGQGAMARSDSLAQGIDSTFQLNVLALVLFSVIAFILVHLLAAQRRARELGLLWAMGVLARQWLTLLVIESIPVLLLGLLAGAGVGLGLSYAMIPFFSQALAGSLPGITIERIVVDWPAVTRLYALLIAVYGSALVLLWLVLTRVGVRWALWTETDEGG